MKFCGAVWYLASLHIWTSKKTTKGFIKIWVKALAQYQTEISQCRLSKKTNLIGSNIPAMYLSYPRILNYKIYKKKKSISRQFHFFKLIPLHLCLSVCFSDLKDIGTGGFLFAP